MFVLARLCVEDFFEFSRQTGVVLFASPPTKYQSRLTTKFLIQSIRAVAIGNTRISADLGSIDIFENCSRAGSKPDVWLCEWFVCCPVGHATFRLMRSKAPHQMNREEMKARRKWNSGCARY